MANPIVGLVKPKKIDNTVESIIVEGQNFSDTVSATVGGSAVTNLKIIDATHIQFTAPAKSAGSYDVVVTNASGASSTNTNDILQYVVRTVVTQVTDTWISYDEYGSALGAFTSLSAAQNFSVAHGGLAIDVRKTKGTVVNGSVVSYDAPH